MNGRTIIKSLLIVSGLLLITPSQSSLFSQETQHLQQRYLNILKMMGEDEYERAIPELKQLISDHPDYSKAYKKIAEAYIFTDNLNGGQDYFEKFLRDDPDNAYAYYGLARINMKKEEYEKAIENLQKCLALDPEFAEAYHSYNGLPEVYTAEDKLDFSIQFFDNLIKSDPQNACAYYGLGGSYLRKYEWDKALNALDQAIQLNPDLTLAYHAMIVCDGSTGKSLKVFETCEKLSLAAKRINDLEMLTYANYARGSEYMYLGDYGKSLHYFNESLKIAQETGDKKREGSSLNSLACIYGELGENSKALEYFKTANKIASKVGDKLTEALTLGNIGTIYMDQKNYDQSLKYYWQALPLASESGYKNEQCCVLTNLAALYENLKEYERAFEYFAQVLKIAREIKDVSRESHILMNLGILSQDVGKNDEASAYLHQALAVASKIQDAQGIWETQSALGYFFEKQDNGEQAINHYAKAIALYDSVRARLGIESLGISFLEDKYEAFPAIVKLLAESERHHDAFIYAEKYKAKGLLEILSQGKFYLETLVPDSLRMQVSQIDAELETIHGELSLERSKDHHDENKTLLLDQQITDLELQKAALIDHVKRNYGAFYQLSTSEPLEISEIQSNVLDGGQALIEYVVGSDKVSVFVITADSVMYQSIEITKDSLRSKLADLSPLFRQQKDTDVQSRQQVLNPQLANFSVPPAHELYEILIQPIEPLFSAADELIIVPDDVLFYLPFETLIVDTTGIENRYDFDKATFLIEKYSISYSASASLLDPRLQRPRSSTQGILALGNPDFGELEDEPLWASSFAYSGGIVRGNRFISLPNSETEVKAIDNVLSGVKNSVYVGNRATEDVFKKQAGHFKILHLATHFLSDDRQPLYSRLVLAQTPNQKEDGYLQPYEIFNMNLNADLAVLSACNTGLGKLSRGEGIVGISRAFMYAGVPSLVVSLWSVDDKATSEIMKNFYKHLQVGLNKKQALRQAKIDYLKTASENSNDPFYWAPFILIGAWSPVQLPTRGISNWWIAFNVVILLAAGVILLIKNRIGSLWKRHS